MSILIKPQVTLEKQNISSMNGKEYQFSFVRKFYPKLCMNELKMFFNLVVNKIYSPVKNFGKVINSLVSFSLIYL